MSKNIDPTKIDLQWFAEDEEVTLTLEQVKDFLTQNKEKPEIVALFSELHPITTDAVSAFLETKEGQDLIQPYGDKRVTSAIETYKKGKFEAEVKARVAAKMLEMNPGETPEQKRIRELEEKDALRDQEWARKELQSQIKELAFNEKVNPKFISGINFASLEEAALYIKEFKTEQETLKTATVNELLASGSYKPKSGNDPSKEKIDISKLTMEEAIELEMNGELDKKIIASNG